MSRARFGYFDTMAERDMDRLDDAEIARINARRRARADTMPAPTNDADADDAAKLTAALRSLDDPIPPTQRQCCICHKPFDPHDINRDTRSMHVCSDTCETMYDDRADEDE